MSSPPTLASPRRRRYVSVVGGTLSMLLGASLVTAGSAQAATGAAPEPHTLTRIAAVHTDAISTFFEAGKLVLGSRADTPSIGTRYDNDDIFFHVDNASKVDSWPAGGPTFVASVGKPVWVAPQTQAAGQIWPGFSTESVPTGTLVGDETTFTLQDVDGPGDVELWQTDAVEAPMRLWSSDEDVKKFTRGRAHLHSNWAFTAPGTYRLTVRADATVQATEQAVSDTTVYTFVVGEVPDAVDTTTTLTSSASSLLDGDSVTFTSDVTPVGVEGAVEFRDGSSVLGHDSVDEAGRAELIVPALSVGSHNVTAVFKPTVANRAKTSTSPAVNVTVTDASGVPFSIEGMAASYTPGDTMSLRAIGVRLKENQEIRWRLRYRGTTTSATDPFARAVTYSRKLDANNDDAEIQATLYDKTAKVTVSETAWSLIEVEHLGGRPRVASIGTAPSPLYPGDVAEFAATGRDLNDGETLVWGHAYSGGLYETRFLTGRWDVSYPGGDPSRVRLVPSRNPEAAGRMNDPLVAFVVKDGVAIARSELTFLTLGDREFNAAGARSVYREGGTAQLDVTPYPVRDGDDFTYTWTFTKYDGETTTTQVWGAAEQRAAATTSPVLTKAMHDGGRVQVTLYNHGVRAQDSPLIRIKVTDDLNSQILDLTQLAAHYHQGDDLRVGLTVDPQPLPGDTVQWQWKWPGTEWQAMPGVKDGQWRGRAEQALNGVQLRAVLTWADTTREPLVSAVRTIVVDDHGNAAVQKPTIGGRTTHVAGQTVSLGRELPAGVSTLLTTHRWERKARGTEAWTTVDGADAAQLSFRARLDDDGAQYRVTVLTPNGKVAYGPSPAVELSVTAAPAPEVVAPTAEAVATSISAQLLTQAYGKPAVLAVSVRPAATGTVRLTAGHKTVSAQLEQGRAALRLPAKALEPGPRSVTVTYDGVPGTFAAATQVVPVTVRKAMPKVRVKVATMKVTRGGAAKFVVTATAPGVRPTGRVTVKVAGTTKTVRLNSQGKAVVRVKISKKASTGRRAVSVRYLGSAKVAQGKAPTSRINVRR